MGIIRVAFITAQKRKKNSCLLTLPSADKNKKKKMASFACVSLGGVLYLFVCLFITSFIYLFYTCFFSFQSAKKAEDIMGCNLSLALTLAVLLGRHRTSEAIVKVPINLLDGFKWNMSLKWMLPWWLADPTNCRCSPVPLPIPYGLPPPPLPPPPLALLPFSTWWSREWGFVSLGPMSHVEDAWSEAVHPHPHSQSRFPNNPLPSLGSPLLCHTTHSAKLTTARRLYKHPYPNMATWHHDTLPLFSITADGKKVYKKSLGKILQSTAQLFNQG